MNGKAQKIFDHIKIFTGKSSEMARKLAKSLFRHHAPPHSSVKELFSPGQEAEGARSSLAQVRNSSSESHLLKTVASGGLWHSEEKSEEARMTDQNSKDWAKLPPARLGG